MFALKRAHNNLNPKCLCNKYFEFVKLSLFRPINNLFKINEELANAQTTIHLKLSDCVMGSHLRY